MKIYKKLFAYVQDKKYLGVLAIIFSAISALLTVYGYYLIYKFLDKLIINSNLSGAESIALKSVITLTSGAIFYFMTSLASAKVILLELIMILFLSGVLFVSFMRMMWYSMYISQGNYAVDTL